MRISGRITNSVLIFIILVNNAWSEDADSPKNPCTLVKRLAGSVTTCITNLGGSSINIDSPGDISKIISSERFACVVKCVMADQGLVNSEGKLDTTGLIQFQQNIPEDMKAKLSFEDLQPCLELAGKFDPNNCKTYSAFSQCQLRLLVKAFQPSALDCFTKIPGVGRLFVMLQSALPASQETGQHLSGIRERLSQGKFREWIGNSSVVNLIKKIDF